MGVHSQPTAAAFSRFQKEQTALPLCDNGKVNALGVEAYRENIARASSAQNTASM